MRHPPLRWNRLTSHIQPSVLRMSGRGLRPAWTRVVKAKVRPKKQKLTPRTSKDDQPIPTYRAEGIGPKLKASPIRKALVAKAEAKK